MKISNPSGLLSRALQSEPKPTNTLPGLVLSVGTGLPGQGSPPVSLDEDWIRRVVGGLPPGLTSTGLRPANKPPVAAVAAMAPQHLLVTPTQVPLVVPEELLEPLETASRQVARSINHYLGTAVDALWFVLHVRGVAHDWNAPDAKRGEILFKVAGLVPGMAGIFNDFSPGMQIPDAWMDGIDFVASSGEKFYEGQVPALGDLDLSQGQRTEIASHLVKLAGATFDCSPQFRALTPCPVAPPPPHPG